MTAIQRAYTAHCDRAELVRSVAADAVCIGLWASHAGEVAAVMPKGKR